MNKDDKKKRLIGRHDGEGVFVEMLEVCIFIKYLHGDLFDSATIMEVSEITYPQVPKDSNVAQRIN